VAQPPAPRHTPRQAAYPVALSAQSGGIDEERAQAALDKLQYNVGVVTVGRGGAESGLTVSWLTQVSFEPAILAFAVDKRHTSMEFLRSTGQFIVNLLGDEQRALAAHFAQPASSRPTKVKVDRVPNRPSDDGGAILSDAVAWIECDVLEIKEVGDHFLVLGSVEDGYVERDAVVMTSVSSSLRYRKSHS
jgi:flavin reductase (DIM6/NTAB) family NADH-FMN oxidoreductase RutF